MIEYTTMEIHKLIDFLKEALLDEPDNHDLRIKLASAYMNSDEPEKARRQVEIVLKQEPDHSQAKQLLSMIDGSLEDEDDEEEEDIEIDLGEDTDEEESIALYSSPQQNVEVGSMENWFEKAQISFEDVGGMHDLKEEIKVSIVYPFEKPELYEKYAKKIGGGMLLYGPPGCGKTYIARATAGEISAMFLSVSIEDILDMWLGQSEKKIHKLFDTAREVSPTVMFIDEVDALGADRMKVTASASSLVNQLLTEMDGIHANNEKVMVIGATNTPWHVDPAFRRPGRFDKVIFVPPPDEIARAEIFKIHMKNKPTDNLDYVELAKKTKAFSGADISKVCDQVTERVMREVFSGGKERNIRMDDFIKVIKESHPTTKEWFSTAKNFARYANESGTYTPILEYMKEQGWE